MTADTEQELTIETAELGHTFAGRELAAQCRAIVGGIAWPGKRPGYGVILARDVREFWPGGHMILLDEIDSWDLGDLIRRCAALSLKYKPKFWAGDQHSKAAGQLIMDNRADGPLKDFYVHHSTVLDMPQAYPYMLATLKDLLREDSRRLFLKASKVLPDLGAIVPEEVPFMQVGEFPAIEALAFAVCELMDDSRWRPQREQHHQRPAVLHPLGF